MESDRSGGEEAEGEVDIVCAICHGCRLLIVIDALTYDASSAMSVI